MKPPFQQYVPHRWRSPRVAALLAAVGLLMPAHAFAGDPTAPLPSAPAPSSWFLGEAMALEMMARTLQDAAANRRSVSSAKMKEILARDRRAGEICTETGDQWVPRVSAVSNAAGQFLQQCANMKIRHCPWLATDMVNHANINSYPQWSEDLRVGAEAMRLWSQCIPQVMGVFLEAQRSEAAKRQEEERRKAEEQRRAEEQRKADEQRRAEEQRKRQDMEAQRQRDDERRRQEELAKRAKEDAARTEAAKRQISAEQARHQAEMQRLAREAKERAELAATYERQVRQSQATYNKFNQQRMATVGAFQGGGTRAGQNSTSYVSFELGGGGTIFPIYSSRISKKLGPDAGTMPVGGMAFDLSFQGWPRFGRAFSYGFGVDARFGLMPVLGGMILGGEGILTARSYLGSDGLIAWLHEVGLGGRAGFGSLNSGAGIIASTTSGSAFGGFARVGTGLHVCFSREHPAAEKDGPRELGNVCGHGLNLMLLADRYLSAGSFPNLGFRPIPGGGLPLVVRVEWQIRHMMVLGVDLAASYPAIGHPKYVPSEHTGFMTSVKIGRSWDTFF